MVEQCSPVSRVCTRLGSNADFCAHGDRQSPPGEQHAEDTVVDVVDIDAVGANVVDVVVDIVVHHVSIRARDAAERMERAVVVLQ